MMILNRRRAALMVYASGAVVALSMASGARATDTAPVADATPAAPTSATDDATRQNNDIAEGSDIVVTGTKANQIAPVTASKDATQPQSIISRSFIEDSLPATADFNQVAMISPSVSNSGGTNGSGLSESKAQIRGFQDGEYNVTYDGVPFGDTNDPTHHSNTFFPSNTVETLIVDRGPGNASQLGQATFGGNLNMFSRATRKDASIELKGSYGSFSTQLERVLAQSGAIDALGGSEIVVSGQHIKSDGERTFSPFKSNNVFGKIMIPIGTNVRLTLLGTYNENSFNQPDNDGATLSQVALYGKYFSLNNDANSQTYFGYNHTHKTTDFEIAKLEADFTSNVTLENRGYTYSYDNETLSGNDVTLYATATPAQIAAANVVKLSQGAANSAGVPGYTKTNKYRVWGDIAKVKFDFGFGTLTVGGWYERSNTYRQQRDVNLLTGAPNFAESNPKDQITGVTITTTPANIKFDQDSHINHSEEFVELELRPITGLKVTPGFKHVSFNRKIDALFNQTTRIPQKLSNTYGADLPFLTVNYAATDELSAYAQYARGFLMPPLSVLYVGDPSFSNVVPERSTNYQGGIVYHGAHVSVDVDAFLIDFKNKFASSAVAGQGTVFTNAGAVRYKGLEGQVTYAFNNGFAVFANGSRNYAKTNNPGVIHQQVKQAPEWTAAGGILYKHGPIRFSLIDKWVGHQWFIAPPGNSTTATSYDSPAYQSNGYNTAIASVRYDIGPVRIGVEVNNLFNSRRVANINAVKGTFTNNVQGTAVANNFDQYFYQAGRSFTGDITLTF